MIKSLIDFKNAKSLDICHRERIHPVSILARPWCHPASFAFSTCDAKRFIAADKMVYEEKSTQCMHQLGLQPVHWCQRSFLLTGLFSKLLQNCHQPKFPNLSGSNKGNMYSGIRSAIWLAILVNKWGGAGRVYYAPLKSTLQVDMFPNVTSFQKQVGWVLKQFCCRYDWQ